MGSLRDEVGFDRGEYIQELQADTRCRIHKRLIDLNAPTEVVKQIIINIEAGVEVEVTIAA